MSEQKMVLVVFDRSTGRTVELYCGSQEAIMQHMREAENRCMGQPQMEIVPLVGTIDDLMITHARYFGGVK